MFRVLFVSPWMSLIPPSCHSIAPLLAASILNPCLLRNIFELTWLPLQQFLNVMLQSVSSPENKDIYCVRKVLQISSVLRWQVCLCNNTVAGSWNGELFEQTTKLAMLSVSQIYFLSDGPISKSTRKCIFIPHIWKLDSSALSCSILCIC